ncbi:glycosyltransferase [Clostridium sp. BJN0001]|uniref:glycosyltransferase family 2 protein n=1 Tax=Clostridium sp. BJN0001 TaxID=2930219 RepID=UPI001FD2B48B|nr:glycosyltransferase [Clostridium sp. BJN0001]
MNNENKLISIIVPVYNVEKYLEKCVNSLINQTYKNIEIILVDDGSKDSSGEICEKLSQKDSRIFVVHKKNGGLSSARNEGLKYAEGSYIGFVDSDDWLSPNMYETLYDILIKNDADISYCKFFKTSNETSEIPKENENKISVFNNKEGMNNFYTDLSVYTIVAWNKLYKRELFLDVRYPEGKIHEDEGTTYKLFYKAEKTVYIDKAFYYYRVNPESITNSKFSKKNLDIIDVYEEKIKFIVDKNLTYLYSKTLKWYMFKLIYCFNGCAVSKNECTIYIDSIKSKFDEAYKKYLKSSEKQMHWIILFKIFKISPSLYNTILKVLK